MYPMMSEREVHALVEFFEKFKPKKILEWGSGGSTVHFSRKYDFIESWTSLENNLTWAEKVRAEVNRRKVHVWYFDNLEDYVKYGALLEKYPDLVLVDGRERVECLKEIHKMIRPRIPVLLHDCGRSRYKEGIEVFDYHEVLVQGECTLMPNSIDKEVSDDGYYHHQGLMLLMKETNDEKATI